MKLCDSCLYKKRCYLKDNDIKWCNGYLEENNENFMKHATREELAEFLVERAEELTAPDGDYHKHAVGYVLGWLKQPYRENADG